MIKSNVNKKVSGQNIKIGNNYSLYCKKKFSEVVNKYAVKAISYSSNITKRKFLQKVVIKRSFTSIMHPITLNSLKLMVIKLVF